MHNGQIKVWGNKTKAASSDRLNPQNGALVAHPASYRTASFLGAGERLGIARSWHRKSFRASPAGRPGIEIDFSDTETTVARIGVFMPAIQSALSWELKMALEIAAWSLRRCTDVK
ncbi:MAG: hypothetical protein CM1200mP41_17950 [Gammaproteobacteria bacterium]|nr:MAG: hypothetical protein CM1200mP41_17950 [Gammaproteobacteria bacterium]